MKSGFKKRRKGVRSLRRKICDADKVELIYSLYEKEMYRVCFGILRNTYAAEDALSESFVKIIRRRDRIENVQSEEVRRFVLRTAKNTAIDMYRKNARDRRYLEGLPLGDKSELSYEPEYVLEDFLSRDEYELLDSLSDKYRIVVECLCFEELSVKETAAVLKMSEACVRKRLERAKKQLAQKLWGNDLAETKGARNEKHK